jgi:uncharacterized protein YfkK (UPF0435 family)
MNGTKVMLRQIPQYTHFEGHFKEYIEAKLLDEIINKSGSKIEVIRSLTTLYDSIHKATNLLDVVYEYAGGGCGRHYPKNSKSIVCQHKKAKHTMFAYLGYSDIDMVKGHPTIAIEMARACGMEPLTAVEYYIDNFDTIVKTVSRFYSADEEEPLGEGDVKRLFNSIIYGGSVNGWKEDMQTQEFPKKIIDTINTIECVDTFKSDIVRFNDEVYKNNKGLVAKVNRAGESAYSKKGTTSSYWFQIIENHVLHILTEFLLEKEIMLPHRFRLEFDGICIPPFRTPYDKDKLTDEINTHMYQATGLHILFKFKDYKPENIYTDILQNYISLNMPRVAEKTEESGDYALISSQFDTKKAGEIVIRRFKDSIVKCGGVVYVKFENVWIHEEKLVNSVLIKFMREIHIMVKIGDGLIISYTNDLRNCKLVIDEIRNSLDIINNSFVDEMTQKNKLYLPFRDGIYSFVKKELIPYENLPDVNFTFKINRNFPVFDKTAHADMMEKLLIPIYPNEEERNYNAHVKSRALAGCFEDKKWYGYCGLRDSGKGTETGLLRKAFGPFVAEFTSGFLVMTKDSATNDPAKALGWVIDKRNCRIIISNEIVGNEKTVLNGGLIKILASGGDEVEARKLYNDASGFVPQFTMFLCYNNYYPCEPADATENLEQFDYKSKFVEEEELIEGCAFLRPKDPNIKKLIKEDIIIDAYILYILNAFTEVRQKAPLSIVDAINQTKLETKESIHNYVIKNFKTTDDTNDRMHTKDICMLLKLAGYPITSIAVGKLMNSIGIGKYDAQCTINKVRAGGYKFIKFIGKTDEDGDEEE